MQTSLRTLAVTAFVSLTLVVLSSCAKHAPVAENTPASPAPESKKVVVARVNGAELTMDALIAMMNRISPKARESMEEHKKRALDKLVFQELAYQQAKSKGLTIGQDKVDMAIKNLKENLGGEGGYTDYLAKQNLTETGLRFDVERRLLIEFDYSKEVLAKVTVPEEEVKQEYEKQKHLYMIPEKTTGVDVWVLKNDDTAMEKKARELLRTIKADAGKNPWHLTLDGSFIIRDFRTGGDMGPEMYTAVKKLKPGELSDVITTPNGLHIIKLTSYSPERQATLDETRDKIALKFKVPAQEKRTREWEQELKAGAKIEIIDIPVSEQPQKAAL